MFQDKIKPGKNYTGSQLFDTGGAFYNMPGYLDNMKVGCQIAFCLDPGLECAGFVVLLSR